MFPICTRSVANWQIFRLPKKIAAPKQALKKKMNNYETNFSHERP
jgi:hypothetical protein